VTNSSGNATSNEAKLTVNSSAGLPPTIQAQPDDQSVNVGSEVSFIISATGDAPLSYQWYKDNEPITSATSDTFTISSVQLSDSGNYKCVVSNNAGDITSKEAILTVNSQANSVSGIRSQLKCTVYPNPASGMLNLQSEEIIDKICITDVTGALIIEKEIKSNACRLNISELEQGIYIISISGKNNAGYIKFLKQ
jgi:hypothetical protein